MYYIVHLFLALKYKLKLRDNLRGVHAITHHLILYYLVKTKRLEQHIYQEYINSLQTTSKIQNLDINEFRKEAYQYAKKYKQQKERREVFTYSLSKSAEEHHAKHSIQTAEEFINTIKQIMI